MTDEIAIERALLLGQVRPPDKILEDDEVYFSVKWGEPWVALAWSQTGHRTAEHWGTNWRLHYFPKGRGQKTVKGFPAVLQKISDPAFRKRYRIEPRKK